MKSVSIVLTALIAIPSIADANGVSIQWKDNTAPDAGFPGKLNIPGTFSPYKKSFSSGNEFRIMTPFIPVAATGEKNIILGTESWVFDGDGKLIEVAGTEMTPGAASSPVAKSGATGLFQNALYISGDFGFIAPTLGSPAADHYGAGELRTTDGADTFEIFFPVLEAQWANLIFPLGSNAERGITFNCTGWQSNEANCHAEHRIRASEDSLGFVNNTAQWELHGTITMSKVPLPAAVWLFGAGLVGLAGFARTKKK